MGCSPGCLNKLQGSWGVGRLGEELVYGLEGMSEEGRAVGLWGVEGHPQHRKPLKGVHRAGQSGPGDGDQLQCLGRRRAPAWEAPCR